MLRDVTRRYVNDTHSKKKEPLCIWKRKVFTVESCEHTGIDIFLLMSYYFIFNLNWVFQYKRFFFQEYNFR